LSLISSHAISAAPSKTQALLLLFLNHYGDLKVPNKSVKGTRRPLAVLKFGFYQGLAASFRFR
jgi:hypothetical protein